MAYHRARITLLPLALALFGCSGTSGSSEFEGTAGAGNGGPGGPGGPGGLVPGDGDGDGGSGTASTSGQCDPNYYDFPDNGFDDDCSGTADDPLASCDQAIADYGEADPMMAASAMGLCKRAQGGSWGIIAARYVKVDGTPGMADIGHGLLTNFGSAVHPREGKRLLALSSGSARNPGEWGYSSPGATMNFTQSGTPAGFPVAFTSCDNDEVGVANANDPAALEVDIRPPQNASGFAFDLNFYTFEFPEYLCSEFNDYYVTIMEPPAEGHLLKNISFDGNGNPISVNSGFVNVCTPGNYQNRFFPCDQGPTALNGTGFEQHAASGWLTTTAPIALNANGTFTLRFAIWDAGDMILDSTILIDNFRWVEGEIPDAPVTTPVPL